MGVLPTSGASTHVDHGERPNPATVSARRVRIGRAAAHGVVDCGVAWTPSIIRPAGPASP